MWHAEVNSLLFYVLQIVLNGSAVSLIPLGEGSGLSLAGRSCCSFRGQGQQETKKTPAPLSSLLGLDLVSRSYFYKAHA